MDGEATAGGCPRLQRTLDPNCCRLGVPQSSRSRRGLVTSAGELLISVLGCFKGVSFGRERRLVRMGEDLEKNPSELEQRYVHQVYSQIAPHFSHTRYKPWPRVRQFLLRFPCEALVADIGCGNGKYFTVTNRIFMIGSDICPELLEIAASQSQRCEVALANNLCLSFRDGIFDGLLSIAVIHHFATEERRRRALEEMARVLKPGGKMLIYVWALEQTSRSFCAQDVLVPWHLRAHFAHAQQSSVDSTNENDVESSRTVKVRAEGKEKWTAEKIIDGAIGVEPVGEKPTEGERPGWGKRLSLGVDKLLSLSPRLGRGPRSEPPPAVPASASEWNRASLVSGVARFSPMLGRRLAAVLGAPPPDELALQRLADDLAVQLIEEVLQQCFPKSKPSEQLDTKAMKTSPPDKNPNENDDGPTFYRYYHVFKQGELDALVSQVPSLKIIDSQYDHANWCIIAEKLQ